MLRTFKRWLRRFSASGSSEPDWSSVADWASQAGHASKRVRDGNGFIVEARPSPYGWRLEWGPSQRNYIAGRELRLRGDLLSGPELRMLVVSRQLMEALEREVFDQYTEDLQTRLDTDTPEEMRWLVMFPKAPQLRAELREHFGAVTNVPDAFAQWLAGALAAKLVDARKAWLAAEDPLVLIAQRGRLTLRTAMAEPDAKRVAAVVSLFEVALREGRRAAQLWSASTHASTRPGMWVHEGPGLDSRSRE